MGRPAVRIGLVLLGVAAFAAATTYLNWVKYVSLRSTWPSDLALFHNGAFGYVHGRDIAYLFSSSWFLPGDHDGPSVFRSTHFSPTRLVLLPQLYRWWPSMTTFFGLHSLAIGAGALALYRFGSRRAGPGPGLFLAGSYLLHPVLLHLAFNDVRDIPLGIAPALFALGFHAERRWRPFGVAALLMLAAREEFALLLALFPVLNRRLTPPEGRRAAWWVAPALLAAAWLLLSALYYQAAYGVPVPHLAVAAHGSGGRLLATLVERLPTFFRLMLVPGVVGLLTPEAFAVALPFVVGARHVYWPGFPPHDLQHLSPAVVAVFWAFTSAVVRWAPWLRRRRPRLAWAAGAAGVLVLLGTAEFARAVHRTYLVGGFPRYEALARASDALPVDATVLVPRRLTARFSHHLRVVDYQKLPLARATRRDADELRQVVAAIVPLADLVVTEREPWLDALVAESGRYGPPQVVAGFHVFAARAGTPRPADPDLALQRALRWEQMSPRERRWATLRIPG